MIRTGKKKASKNRMIKVLDDACKQRVHERDDFTCQRCGRKHGEWDAEVDRPTQIQWSHIYSREYHCIRWDDDNSLDHCDRCHCWFTHHHTAGIRWFSEKFPARWDRISTIFQSGAKADVKALYEKQKILEAWGKI